MSAEIEDFMTRKKIRTAAYGMTAMIAMSAMSINVQAENLQDILPSAGIGVTFSNGVTLAQIQERTLAEAALDENMKLSVSEMKAYLEEQKAVQKTTIVSASIVKAAEVQQVLAQIEVEQAEEALAKQEAGAEDKAEEMVIATVANAGSNGAFASGSVNTITEEQVPMASGEEDASAEGTESEVSDEATENEAPVENTESEASGEAAEDEASAKDAESEASVEDAKSEASDDKAEEDSPAASEDEKTSEDKAQKETPAEEKPIETTQSAAELAAMEAASMTDEEKEFSNLVIARVNSYVNVRSDASEDSEVVGKLYDKSVGTFLSEKDGWYEINSGNVTGYVKGEYCVTGRDAIELAKEVGTRIATVNTITLYVREDATTESSVIGYVPMEEELTVIEEKDGWAKVDIEEGYGWVSMDYVILRTDFVKAESKAEEEARLAKEAEERRKAQAAANANSRKPESGSNKNYNSASSYIPAGGGSASGNAVAEFALQFKGNPYVYGGTSLTNGADCSGFVMSVYQNFGVSLPHSSSADRHVGSAVGSLAEAQPGDIICYSGHVGLYIGGNQIVHASTSRTGIIVSRADYRNILAIRRIF